ncbi:MAG TPA: hypothetical protein VF773_20285 [Verrucomicrobiae bacterium]
MNRVESVIQRQVSLAASLLRLAGADRKHLFGETDSVAAVELFGGSDELVLLSEVAAAEAVERAVDLIGRDAEKAKMAYATGMAGASL